MELISMEKDMFENTISTQFKLSPIINIFHSVDLSQLLYFNDTTFQNVSASFDSSSGMFTISFDYSEDA